MNWARHKPLPQASSLDMFVEQFHTTLGRYAGRRITKQEEVLVRAAMASLVRRGYSHGVLPQDGRLIVTKTLDGLAFRVTSELGVIAEGFVPDCRTARPHRSRRHSSAAT